LAATEEATYTAQWEEIIVITYQITFDANGGEGGEVQMVEEGTIPVRLRLSEKAIPLPDGILMLLKHRQTLRISLNGPSTPINHL
jgi:hypothetical protein